MSSPAQSPGSQPSPRLPYLDKGWLRMMVDDYRRLTAEITLQLADVSIGERIGPWSSAASLWRNLALVTYAAGAGAGEVRSALESAARAELHVLEMRGPRREQDQLVERADSWSTGNSCQALRAMEMALAAGIPDLARGMASLVWDPEGASYVGPGSVLCTNKQQAIAYAFRDIVLGDDAAAVTQLRRLAMVPEELVGPLKMLRGLAARQGVLFQDGLSTTLAWHEREARKRSNEKRAELFLSIPALGFVALALSRGLAVRDQLVADSVYFPRDLIDAIPR